jgi:hypothetical protein
MRALQAEAAEALEAHRQQVGLAQQIKGVTAELLLEALTFLLVVVVVLRGLAETLRLLVMAVLAEQVFRHLLLVRQLVVLVVAVAVFLQLVTVALQLMAVRLVF